LSYISAAVGKKLGCGGVVEKKKMRSQAGKREKN